MSEEPVLIDNASDTETPQDEEVIHVDIDEFVKKNAETAEQSEFNSLTMDDKLARLNRLVQKSQVYSQIILDNMLERSLQKKRLQEKIARGEVVEEPQPIIELSDSLSDSDSDSNSDSDSDSETESTEESTMESESDEETETVAVDEKDNEGGSDIDSDEEVVVRRRRPREVDLGRRTTRSAQRAATLSATTTAASKRAEKPIVVEEVIEIDLDSESDDSEEVEAVRTTRSGRVTKRRSSNLASSSSKRPKNDSSPRKLGRPRKHKKPKKSKKSKKPKLKKPKNRASNETKLTRQAIEAAQTGHKQSQPTLVTGCTMKDYQLDGLEWLVTLYENGLNGILADEMGLGKTLQCISLICYLIEHGVKGPFLVVAPLSTVSNWCREFGKFAPKVKVMQYSGERSKRKKQSFGRRMKAQVVVTSYDLIIKDYLRFKRVNWSYLTVDEGHRLKNFQCLLVSFLKRLDVGNRLLLTGTPLQNNLKELWSLLNFILPDIFQDLELFQQWFDIDDLSSSGDSDINEQEQNALKKEVQDLFIRNLHSILKPFMLRRIKKEVMKDLPPKKEYILYSRLTPIQKVFYLAVMESSLPETILDAYVKELLVVNHSDMFNSIEALERADEILKQMTRIEIAGPKRPNQKRFQDKDIQRLLEGNNSDLESDTEYLPDPPASDSENGVNNEEQDEQDGLARLNELVADYEDRVALEDSEQVDNVGVPQESSNGGVFSHNSQLENPGTGPNTLATPPSEDEATKQNSSNLTTAQSTPVPDAKLESRIVHEVASDGESEDEFHSLDGDSHDVIEVLSDEDTEETEFSLVRKARMEFIPHHKQLLLKNAIMQMRKVCASHYCYYSPVDKDEQLAKLVMENSCKMQMLKQLLTRLTKENHKVLVFSQFTTVLDYISLCLEEDGISCSQLDGRVNIDVREEEIKNFSSEGEDSSQVFLLSTRAGGLGLNLVLADTVILFDNDWNPQMDLQAIGRVHRIGQTKPVKIFRFVVRDTIEELLIFRSFNKRLLEKMVIQLGNFQLGRVAQKLADHRIDLDNMSRMQNLLTVGRKLNLHGSGDYVTRHDFNKIVLQPHEIYEPLTSEEMDELMDRSDECYSREPANYTNVTVFESSTNG